MAGKIFVKSATAVAIAALVTSLGACKIETNPTEDVREPELRFAPEILHYTQTLALLGSALEDFESGASATGFGPAQCVRAYNCSDQELITSYVSCANSEGGILNGKTQIQFSTIDACMRHQNNFTPQDLTLMTKYYLTPALTRNDGGSLVELGTSGRVTASYSDGTTDHNLAVDDIERKLSGRFDFLFRSPSQINFRGERVNGTRQITSGQLNVREFVGGKNYELNFFQVRWARSSCCYPTSGTIFSTSAGRSDSLQFKNTCGRADYTNSEGTVTELSLFGACE